MSDGTEQQQSRAVESLAVVPTQGEPIRIKLRKVIYQKSRKFLFLPGLWRNSRVGRRNFPWLGWQRSRGCCKGC